MPITLDKLNKIYLFARTLKTDNPSLKILFWGVYKKQMDGQPLVDMSKQVF